MRAPALHARISHARWRAIALATLLVVYIVFIIAVVKRTPLVRVDKDIFRLDLRERFPGWYPTIHTLVMFGQRGPATLVALPWFVWMAWKYRTARPLIMLVTALIVLNVSVGVVKVATGRLGPLTTHRAHALFQGGNIFPSGHTSNTVVLYGVMAMLALSYRKTVIFGAVIISLVVGFSTIYLDTHWFTDVVGGWMAGGLVLLVLPSIMPFAERWYARAARRVKPHLQRRMRFLPSVVRPVALAPQPLVETPQVGADAVEPQPAAGVPAPQPVPPKRSSAPVPANL
jgi:membrane-associated phospholipid phosphatase